MSVGVAKASNREEQPCGIRDEVLFSLGNRVDTLQLASYHTPHSVGWHRRGRVDIAMQLRGKSPHRRGFVIKFEINFSVLDPYGCITKIN